MYPISSDPNDSDTQSSSFLYRPATHPTKLREPERRTCLTSDTLREGGTNQTIVLESLIQREKLVAGPRSSEINSQSCSQGQSGNRVLNTLVVIKDDHLPPLKWRLRRVLELPGKEWSGTGSHCSYCCGAVAADCRQAMSTPCVVCEEEPLYY